MVLVIYDRFIDHPQCHHYSNANVRTHEGKNTWRRSEGNGAIGSSRSNKKQTGPVVSRDGELGISIC